MLNVVIVEDNPKVSLLMEMKITDACKMIGVDVLIQGTLCKYLMEQIHEETSNESLVYARELLTKKNPDVLILDIQLGEHESGLDILESNPNFETIIATGYADLGIQSLKYNIAGVFFKTDSIASLATLLYKTKKVQAIKSIDEESAYLTLPKGRKINVNRIESVVAAGNYATIHYHRSTDPGAFLYATYFENLTTVLQELPEHFCRCHSSWILNPFWIVQIHTRQDEHGRDTVALMFDGTIIPIARDRKKDVFEHCKKYNPRLIK